MGKSYKEVQPLTLPSEVELEEVQAKVYDDL